MNNEEKNYLLMFSDEQDWVLGIKIEIKFPKTVVLILRLKKN